MLDSARQCCHSEYQAAVWRDSVPSWVCMCCYSGQSSALWNSSVTQSLGFGSAGWKACHSLLKNMLHTRMLQGAEYTVQYNTAPSPNMSGEIYMYISTPNPTDHCFVSVAKGLCYACIGMIFFICLSWCILVEPHISFVFSWVAFTATVWIAIVTPVSSDTSHEIQGQFWSPLHNVIWHPANIMSNATFLFYLKCISNRYLFIGF